MHERISTGSKSLDKMLNGGFFESRPYLITGEPGTGKTMLCLRFLLDGIERGEDCLFVTIDETPQELRTFVEPLGWNLKNLAILDAFPEVRSFKRASDIQEVASFGGIKVMRESKPTEDKDEDDKSSSFKPVELSIQSLQMTMKKEFQRKGYDRMVIDSFTSLRLFGVREEDSALGIQSLLRLLSEMETTTLITMNPPDEQAILAERFIARGEIRLLKVDYEGYTRAVRIERFRGSEYDMSIRPFKISSKGIDIDLSRVVPCGDAGKVPCKPKPAVGIATPHPTPQPVPKRIEKIEAEEMLKALKEQKLRTEQLPSAQEISEHIAELEEMIKECIRLGMDVRDVRVLVSRAKVHLRSRRPERAHECAQRCEECLLRKIEDYETFISTVM